MKNKVLIIIDMQEHFRRKAERMGIIPRLQKLIKDFRENKIPIVWTQHGHRNLKNDGGQLFKWWGEKGCMMYGSEGWKIMKEFSPSKEDYVISSKTRYDAFHGTELLTHLKLLGAETLVISGTLTNLCCENTARTAFNHDFEVLFLEDGTAASTNEMHQASLLNLKYGYAKIVTVDQLVNLVNAEKNQDLSKIEVKVEQIPINNYKI